MELIGSRSFEMSAKSQGSLKEMERPVWATYYLYGILY